MSATIIDIADAVVVELNVASRFSMAVEAERTYVPIFELEGMDTLRVPVVFRADASQRADRTRWQRDYRIEVGILKRVSRDDQKAEADELTALVEEMAEYFRTSRPLSALQQFHCAMVENDPVYDPEHLDRLSQFTSLLILTFREWR